ncbi:Hypothetical predicted protein [Octopus vulgaris]|uniref:Uncharacterized protein n=1 Tax=Octopus vulgaris TaxID=6645 RepID=A0AA36BD54_OCTVU|nr:Hypothetical predicted protein [Octopus vulgaris]
MGRSRLLVKSRFVRHGLPFITLIVGGSFLLKEYATLRRILILGRTFEGLDLGKIRKQYKIYKGERPVLEVRKCHDNRDYKNHPRSILD